MGEVISEILIYVFFFCNLLLLKTLHLRLQFEIAAAQDKFIICSSVGH